MPKFRCLRSRRLTRGFATISSITMKAVRNTTAMIASLRMNGDASQSSLLPSSSTVWNADNPIVIAKMPAQSPSLRRPNFIGLASSVSAKAITMIRLGRGIDVEDRLPAKILSVM